MLACGNCLLLYSSKKAAILSATRGPRFLPSLRRCNNARQYLLSELWETSVLKVATLDKPSAAEPAPSLASNGSGLGRLAHH